jgi:hypothetical protein
LAEFLLTRAYWFLAFFLIFTIFAITI